MPPLTEEKNSSSDLRRKRRYSRDGLDSKRFKVSETTESAVKRMNRKDLEQLVLEKIVEVMVANSNLGEMVRKFDRLNADFIKVNDKATVLRKQLSDLQEVTKRIKVLEETKSIRIPKITRSVGLQVTSVTKAKVNNVSTNGINKEVIDLVEVKKVDMTKDRGSFSDVIPQLNDKVRTGLKTSDDISCSPSEKKDNKLIKHSIVAKKSTGGKNGSSRKLDASIDSKDLMPLSLAVEKSNGSDGIVIKWWSKNLESLQMDKIRNYELEGAKRSEGEQGDFKWSRIGEMIKPLPLPMACNLNNFRTGIQYHFSVEVLTDNEVYYSNVSSIMI